MAIYDFTKHFKGNRLTGSENKGCTVQYGEFGLAANSYCRITEKQLEAIRMTVSKEIKGMGKLFIRINPNIVVTKKPAESRMGSGKGAVDHKIFPLKPGRVILEITNLPLHDAKRVLSIAGSKLSCTWKIVRRQLF